MVILVLETSPSQSQQLCWNLQSFGAVQQGRLKGTYLYIEIVTEDAATGIMQADACVTIFYLAYFSNYF